MFVVPSFLVPCSLLLVACYFTMHKSFSVFVLYSLLFVIICSSYPVFFVHRFICVCVLQSLSPLFLVSLSTSFHVPYSSFLHPPRSVFLIPRFSFHLVPCSLFLVSSSALSHLIDKHYLASLQVRFDLYCKLFFTVFSPFPSPLSRFLLIPPSIIQIFAFVNYIFFRLITRHSELHEWG